MNARVVLLLAMSLVVHNRLFAAPTYSIRSLGLTDAIHTFNGESHGYAELINDDGYVAGTSSRYVNGESAGSSAWLFDGTQTFDISPVGPEYLGTGGLKDIYPVDLNSQGSVVGIATLWPGEEETGLATWLYDGASTRDIGLTDAEHIRSDGFRYSELDPSGVVYPGMRDFVNSSNQVTGSSSRYNGSQYIGRSAWVFDGTTTQKIGYIDTDHTRADGYRDSAALNINDAGQVIGWSRQYIPSLTTVGQTSWFYENGNLIQLGLTGAEHTGTSGLRFTWATKINSTGHVIGASQRYQGTTSVGQSAWIYHNGTTTQIGLYDSEHTSSSGVSGSAVLDLNESGQAVGYAARWNGGSIHLGVTAWVYDGIEATRIGLIDSQHTNNAGKRESFPAKISEFGHVIGNSIQYAPTGNDHDNGYSAWYFDGNMTKRIGLYGAEYIGPAGQEVSVARLINIAGQATGSSTRFLDAENFAQDAWFYDAALDQTFPLRLSMRSDGFSYSTVHHLSDDGYALGYYQAFDELDNDLGYKPFYFSVEDGLHDLGELVESGLAANGWQQLFQASFANSAGQIVGYGDLAGGVVSSTPLLLTPITADFNNDGNINGRDFLAWQRGESPNPFSAEDLAIWQSQYGNNNALSANVAVPEPNAAVLSVFGLLFAALVKQGRPAIR